MAATHTAHMGTATSPATTSTKKSVAKKSHKINKTVIITWIGRIASLMSIIMYVSYIAQIGDNLAGHPGNPLQPLAAFFNCIFWSIYGFFGEKRDWPIVCANVPGIFLAGAAFLTSVTA